MVKRLLDRGTYDFLELKLDVDIRGRSAIRLIGIGKSQEQDVQFEVKLLTHVVKGWPVISDLPEPEVIEVSKRGPGRPPSSDKGD